MLTDPLTFKAHTSHITSLAFAPDSNYFPAFASRKFSRQEPYFRIIHKGPPRDYNCPPGFHYETAAPGEQASAIAGLIRNCYDDIDVDKSTIPISMARAWARQSSLPCSGRRRIA